MFFKKLLMPCGLCVAASVIKPGDPTQVNMASPNKPEIKRLVRPSELPIYAFEENYSKQTPCTDCPPSALEGKISEVRKSVQLMVLECQHYTDMVSDTIGIGVEHSKSLLDYLHEEGNIMPRIGAIGIGGLSGLVLGLRGRTFKRLVYSSTGALVMAGVCYPKKMEEGFDMTKHYANVGYNFVYGVKPGDNQQLENAVQELPKFKIPANFSEFVDLTLVVGSQTTTAVRNTARNIYTYLYRDQEEKQPSADLDKKQN